MLALARKLCFGADSVTWHATVVRVWRAVDRENCNQCDAGIDAQEHGDYALSTLCLLINNRCRDVMHSGLAVVDLRDPINQF